MEKWGPWDHRRETYEAQVFFIRSLETGNVDSQGFC